MIRFRIAALVAAMLLLSSSALAATPATDKAQTFVSRLVSWMDHCREQGDHSLYGVYACDRFRGALSPALRHDLESTQPWMFSELTQVAKKLAQRDLSSSQDFQLISEETDPARFSAVFPGLIRFTLNCSSPQAPQCEVTSYEWLLFKTVLYCVATLSDMNDYHLSILRNPGLDHLAVQVFDRSQEDPARISVKRRIFIEQGRAQYSANDFLLEVDLPPMGNVSEMPQVEGRLVSFVVYGSPVQLSCHWKDPTTPTAIYSASK